ncbi:MAG: hypothetical protein L6Q75_19605 [Burkholderiaceae bacterium]|nr:hypothetical protein [Burkholderiaceae bacterium]
MTTRKAGSPAAACATQARRLSHAYRARLARILARRAAACALRRAELRARAAFVVAADRLSRGGAA